MTAAGRWHRAGCAGCSACPCRRGELRTAWSTTGRAPQTAAAVLQPARGGTRTQKSALPRPCSKYFPCSPIRRSTIFFFLSPDSTGEAALSVRFTTAEAPRFLRHRFPVPYAAPALCSWEEEQEEPRMLMRGDVQRAAGHGSFACSFPPGVPNRTPLAAATPY